MLGFARNSFFLDKRSFRCGEKLARFRDGFGRHRFTVKSCPNCACSGTEGSSWLFLFFADAVLLCFPCVEMLCALELPHPSDVFYSSVSQVLCALQLSVLGGTLRKLCSTKYYWEVLCASFVVRNNTGKHFAQAL